MSELINFRMEGPVLKESIPLYIALIGLDKLQNILDKSYLAISGNQRISPKSREEFRITFTEIRKGSIEANLELFVATVVAAQQTMPFITALTPKSIWDLTQNAFDYLKFVLKAVSNGKVPTYNQTGDGMILVNNGDGDITINKNTYIVGKESLGDYQEIAKLTKGGIDSICFDKKDHSSIEINKSNSALFFPKAQVSPENIQLTCEIFDFNKHKMGGKIAVPSGQPIPEGDYNFELIGNQDMVPYIQSMLKTKVNISCLQETSPNPFGSTNILKLQVIDIIQKNETSI
jgi:hypothetical protein